MTTDITLERLISELDASARMRGAQHVQAHVARVRALLAGHAPAEDLALATAELVQAAAGADFQRFIEDTERGEKVIEGARAGHEAVYGTPQEKDALHAAYQETVDKKHRDRPAITSWMRLSDLVAEECDCSGWTIRRYTRNPLKG